MPVYINKKSNHLATIIKEMPKAMGKRIRTFLPVKLFLMSQFQYIQTHSEKVLSMGILHLSQKPLRPRQTRKSQVT